MTMPHLMNCSHSPDGWCLECVKKMENDHQEALAALRELSSARLDREGRDVSDLPGLWDEGDTFEKASK